MERLILQFNKTLSFDKYDVQWPFKVKGFSRSFRKWCLLKISSLAYQINNSKDRESYMFNGFYIDFDRNKVLKMNSYCSSIDFVK